MGNRGLVRAVVRALVALLVGSLLTQVPSAAAAVADVVTEKVAIPPIRSPRASLVPSAPPGDGGVLPPDNQRVTPPPASERPSARELTGFNPVRSTELPAERTATHKVFANPDGTRTTKAFSAPVHMQDAAGAWVDIDTTLQRGADGRLRPTAAPGSPDFAPTATDPVLARVTLDDGHSVGFGLSGASPLAQAVHTGSKVTYPAAVGTASLTLAAKPTGVKEEIVLAAPGGPTSFEFPLHLGGLTAEVDAATGDVVYRDDAGAVRARTPHGWMRDNGADAHGIGGETSTGVAYTLVPGADGRQVLRVTLDEQWLADEARQWPVTVDPSVWFSTDLQDDTYITTGVFRDAGWEDWLQVGTENGGANVARSYMHFDVGGLDWQHILSATFHAYQFHAKTCSPRGIGVYRVTQGWGGHSMTGFPGATFADQVAWSSFNKGAPGCPDGWTSWNVLDTVNKWTHGTWDDLGLMMKVDPGSETDNNAFKAFYSWDRWEGDWGDPYSGVPGIPHIEIVWNRPPSTPSLNAPGNGDTAHNLRPTLSAGSTDADGDTLDYGYRLCGVITGVNQCVDTWGENLTSWQVPEGWLDWNQSYTWQVQAYDGVTYSPWSGTRTFSPTNQTPSTPALRSPVGTDAVVGSSTLSFTADSTDANGDPITYRFQVATGSDGQTGRLATSTWQSDTTWTPPAGTFADGGTYYWTAQAQDSLGATTGWQTAQQFRIDFRLGRRDTMPYDSLGPATVNLSNGNLLLSVDGPSFPTVGGPVGVGFSYNSQTPVVRGLVADYYQDLDADGAVDAGEPNLLHRIDTGLSFNWGSPGDGPNPGVLNPEHWVGHWSGAIRVPSGPEWGPGDYVFVSDRSDDSVTLRTGGPSGPVVLSAPGCCQYVTGQAVSLSPTSGTPIDLVYNQVTGPQSLRIKIRKASAPAGSEIDIPADWLTPTQPALPDGWSRSADAPVPNAYTSVRPVTGTTTAVVDDAGTDHLWTWTGTSWAPPAGEDGVLTQNADGTWSLSGDDGYLYTFEADGRLRSIVSATDDLHPGAPTYAFTRPNPNGPYRLTTITDAADRTVTLVYGPSTACPTASGFATTAPADMLCKVTYTGFGGGSTDLLYSLDAQGQPSGHLARVVNPGGATVDFGYDTTGLLRSMRDVLTNDLIAGGVITDGTSDTHRTLIDYADGRVVSVKGPVADASVSDAERPRHIYAWTVDATTKLVTRAKVDVAGLSGETGQPADTRVVDLDSGGHATHDVDVAGIAVDSVWDNLNDRPNRVTDGHSLTSPAGGLVTTTKYDAAGRITDTYGPALDSEWTGGVPSASVPTTHTNYDEGMPGLAATWFGTAELTGVPKRHSTSALNENWGTGSPGTSVPVDNFSGRLTGEVTVPGNNPATLTLNADGGRIFVDGALASGNTWGGPYRSALRADNPVDHWRLGDPTGSATAADSAGFSPGTYTGGVTRTGSNMAADSDTASQFDGVDDHVTLPAGFENLNAGMTVEAWVRPTAVGPWSRIVDLGNGAANDNIVFARNGTSNTLTFEVYNGGTSGGKVDAPNALVLNSWQHVAATVTASGAVTIYVNRTQVATGTTAVPRAVKRNNNYIGRSNWSGDAHWAGYIDEVALYPSVLPLARITAHYNAAFQASNTATATVQPGTHSLRIEYQELAWTAGLTVTSNVGGTTFAPRYNLATSRKDADHRWTKTEYATPEVGLPTATVVDPVIAGVNPGGLDLRSATSYEPASATTFFRRTSRTLPKGAATAVSYTHYLIDETADNPCPGGAMGVNQAGALKRETDADPDGGGPNGPIVREYRYDAAGRVVATRIVGDAAWTCTSYDSRGRVTSRTDFSGKTTTYVHAADRVTETATGSDGVTRSTVSRVDWLGRAVAYTDELGTVTRRTFDQLGRLIGVYRTFAGGGESTVQTLAYDTFGRLASTTEFLSNGPRTTTHGYNAAGQPNYVGRPNGLVTITGYDTARGWVSTLDHTRNSTRFSKSEFSRNGAGDVIYDHITSSFAPWRTLGYGKDGAGRLRQVVTTTAQGQSSRDYGHDANSNRCALAPSCATPAFVHDNADRLLSSPYATGYDYDAHGNLASAMPTGGASSQSVEDGWSFDTAASNGSRSKSVTVNTAGTLTAATDSTAAPVYASATPSGSIPVLGTWTTTIPVRGASYLDTALTWTAATTGFADLTARYKDGAGTVVKTVTDSDGALDLSFLTSATPGTYTVEIVNNSAIRNVPSFSAPWSATVSSVANVTPSLGAGSTWTTPLTADGEGRVSVDLSYDRATHSVSSSPSGWINQGATASHVVPVDATGPISASVDWAGSTVGESGAGHVGGVLDSSTRDDNVFVVTGNGTITTSISWAPSSTAAPLTPDLALVLLDADGNEVARSDGTGTSESITYTVGGLTYPATRQYTRRVVNKSALGTPYTYSLAYPVLADLDLELYDPSGTKVASSTSTSAKPETLSHTIPSGGPTGDYTLKVISKNHAAAYDLEMTHPQSAYATVTGRLKDSTGNVVTSTESSNGRLVFDRMVAAGNYTLELQNASADLAATSPSVTASAPRLQYGPVGLKLKNASGTTVATATGNHPATLSTAVTPGTYALEATPTGGAGTATMTASVPRQPRMAITYDADDHATVVDDGATTVSETLAPSGRVLRHVVTDNVTGTALEDTDFGYDGPGDSPAYSRPHGGGTVTTYLGDVVYTGTTGVWRVVNLHGDVVGTTDAAGTFTARPSADEFGVGQAPADRLGWLGGKDRFHVGGSLGLIRMGVRLYDTRTGRFTSADPVEGGTPNDYVYPTDPVNEFDLDGRAAWHCQSHWSKARCQAEIAKERARQRAAAARRSSPRRSTCSRAERTVYGILGFVMTPPRLGDGGFLPMPSSAPGSKAPSLTGTLCQLQHPMPDMGGVA